MTPTRRRPADVSVHDFHHQLIAERFAAWRATPRRSARDRRARRERGKEAWWTLTGHLRTQHHHHGSFLRVTYDVQGDELELTLDDLRDAVRTIDGGLNPVTVRELGMMEVRS